MSYSVSLGSNVDTPGRANVQEPLEMKDATSCKLRVQRGLLGAAGGCWGPVASGMGHLGYGSHHCRFSVQVVVAWPLSPSCPICSHSCRILLHN